MNSSGTSTIMHLMHQLTDNIEEFVIKFGHIVPLLGTLWVSLLGTLSHLTDNIFLVPYCCRLVQGLFSSLA